MPERKRRGCRPAPDADVLLAQLCSADEQVRVKALQGLPVRGRVRGL